MLRKQSVRFPVQPRDVPLVKAARRLHLTPSEFEAKLPELFGRNFPLPDPTTGMFDLKAIDDWMDGRNPGPVVIQGLRDARDGFSQRLARLG